MRIDSVPPLVVTPTEPEGPLKRDRTCPCQSSCPHMDIRIASYHGYDLRLHLPHTREHIRVNRVRDGEFPKCLCLQADQVLPTMIDGPADSAVLPPRMLHLRQLIQLVAHLLLAPSFGREGSGALHAGTRLDKLLLKLEDCLSDLSLYLRADTGEAQEDAEEGAAGVGVDVNGGADRAAAFQLVEELARPAQEEKDEDDIAKPASATVSIPRITNGGRVGTYRSTFSAASCPPRAEVRALNVSRRLTGTLEEPGIFVIDDPQLLK